MHGNQPSRGAQIDRSIAHEEAELVEKKQNRASSNPGKQNGGADNKECP